MSEAGVRQVVVLGAAGGFMTDGAPCSGLLLDWDGWRLLLDLGYGTLPRLLHHVPDGDVDAVVVTHEHPDHCSDLHGLFRLRRHGHPGAPRVPLYCPPGVVDVLAGIEPGVDLAEVFDHRPLPGDAALGPFRLTAAPVQHHVATVGVRLTGAELVLAYVTDTGPSDVITTLGRDADLLVLDATDRPGETAQPERTLLTATEAGDWATRAGARRLLLTHRWPGTDPATAITDARRGFDGDVDVATAGLVVDLRRASRV